MHTETMEEAVSKPAAPQCPTGRFEVTGEVVSTKIIPDNGYGISRKMLVNIGGGVRIFGMAPLGVAVGSIVRMRATMNPSKSDGTFGFFSRPQMLSVKAKVWSKPSPQSPLPENEKVRQSL